jgi:hypothetical protein
MVDCGSKEYRIVGRLDTRKSNMFALLIFLFLSLDFFCTIPKPNFGTMWETNTPARRFRIPSEADPMSNAAANPNLERKWFERLHIRQPWMSLSPA